MLRPSFKLWGKPKIPPFWSRVGVARVAKELGVVPTPLLPVLSLPWRLPGRSCQGSQSTGSTVGSRGGGGVGPAGVARVAKVPGLARPPLLLILGLPWRLWPSPPPPRYPRYSRYFRYPGDSRGSTLFYKAPPRQFQHPKCKLTPSKKGRGGGENSV